MSKYGDYWKNSLEDIKKLLQEALLNGKSRKTDLVGLKELGNRQHWYGRVDIN